MRIEGFALFDTAIGRCGIARGPRGIDGVQLPETREVATRACWLRQFPNAREAAPPADVQRAIDGQARPRSPAAVPPPRLRCRTHHPAGGNPDLR